MSLVLLGYGLTTTVEGGEAVTTNLVNISKEVSVATKIEKETKVVHLTMEVNNVV